MTNLVPEASSEGVLWTCWVPLDVAWGHGARLLGGGVWFRRLGTATGIEIGLSERFVICKEQSQIRVRTPIEILQIENVALLDHVMLPSHPTQHQHH